MRKELVVKAAAAVLGACLFTGCGINDNNGQVIIPEEQEAQEQENQNVTIGNPWRKCTWDEMKAACDGLFNMPKYSMSSYWGIMENVGEGERPLVEADFTLDGVTYCARAQQGVDESADISGYYYEWTSDEEVTLENWNMTAKLHRFIGEEGMIDLIVWYDPELKTAYSVAANAEDLTGFDIVAVVDSMYYAIPEEYDPNRVYDTYSNDGSVYIHEDYNTMEATLVDGDIEIPIDISMAGFLPQVAKWDVDGDGEDEYVIVENEGHGTGFAWYGLVIGQLVDGEYQFTTYTAEYFIPYIQEAMEFTYDSEAKTITFTINNPGGKVQKTTEPLARALEYNEDVENIGWGDLVNVYLDESGMPYVSFLSGIVYDDSVVPDYEGGVEVEALITVAPDSSIIIGDFHFYE